MLVDTPVWSELFRRARPNVAVADALQELIVRREALLIGPVRQEILSGSRDPAQFTRLCTALRDFPDTPLVTADYENAAVMFTRCRSQGIQGSNTDFLLCSVALRLKSPVFTLDKDFDHFSSVLQIELYSM